MHLFLFEENAEGVDAALLIVLITIFTAALALQMERFGADAAQMLDRAQQFAVQSMGIRAQGETVAAYGWSDVYRQWLEWDSRTTLAQAEGDEAAASRYRAVRDRAVALTPLLSSAFFDSASGQPPNIRAIIGRRQLHFYNTKCGNRLPRLGNDPFQQGTVVGDHLPDSRFDK